MPSLVVAVAEDGVPSWELTKHLSVPALPPGPNPEAQGGHWLWRPQHQMGEDLELCQGQLSLGEMSVECSESLFCCLPYSPQMFLALLTSAHYCLGTHWCPQSHWCPLLTLPSPIGNDWVKVLQKPQAEIWDTEAV
jgi:hypothetical protein